MTEFLGGETVAKFKVPDWGDKVNSGMGLSYRPARLHRLAGRYENSMPESTIYLNIIVNDTILRRRLRGACKFDPC
jgi:hypothetical protein